MTGEITRLFPQIATEIINLDDPCVPRPDNVFAVPTYLLDGKVISLGNPRRDQMFAKLAEELSESCSIDLLGVQQL